MTDSVSLRFISLSGPASTLGAWLPPKVIHFSVTVNPDQDASFDGGEAKLKEYFKKNVVDKLPGDVFNRYQPDLVLMDVMMPVMNGYDSALAIKKDVLDRYVPIIFLTAVTDEDALAEALRGGGDDFLTKPFNEDILIAKIKAHSRIKELNDEVSTKNLELLTFKNIMDSETEIAEHVFSTALKQNYLDSPHLQYYVSPCSTFNGDLLLGAVGPSGSMYMMLADFTGHGLPAAIGAIPVSQHFFSLAKKGAAVGDMVEELNHHLCNLLPSTMFCAAVIIEQSKSGQEFTVWSGGLPSGYILGQDHKVRGEVQSQHMPLAVLEPYEFDRQVEVFRLREGESVFFFTDGLTEALNAEGDMFTEERLVDNMTAHGSCDVPTIVSELETFLDGTKAEDDITMLKIVAEPLQTDDLIEVGLAAIEPVIGWTLDLHLDADALRKDLPMADQLVGMLGDQPLFIQHRDYLHTIFVEFYSNALEHGILGLKSNLKDDEDGYLNYYMLRAERLAALEDASININLQLLPGSPAKLKITFKDSGSGFDYTQIKPSCEEDSYGRGILLVRQMSESLEYSEGGTKVDAVYPLGCVSTRFRGAA